VSEGPRLVASCGIAEVGVPEVGGGRSSDDRGSGATRFPGPPGSRSGSRGLLEVLHPPADPESQITESPVGQVQSLQEPPRTRQTTRRRPEHHLAVGPLAASVHPPGSSEAETSSSSKIGSSAVTWWHCSGDEGASGSGRWRPAPTEAFGLSRARSRPPGPPAPQGEHRLGSQRAGTTPPYSTV
jgi:hypothetical protein